MPNLTWSNAPPTEPEPPCCPCGEWLSERFSNGDRCPCGRWKKMHVPPTFIHCWVGPIPEPAEPGEETT